MRRVCLLYEYYSLISNNRSLAKVFEKSITVAAISEETSEIATSPSFFPLPSSLTQLTILVFMQEV